MSAMGSGQDLVVKHRGIVVEFDAIGIYLFLPAHGVIGPDAGQVVAMVLRIPRHQVVGEDHDPFDVILCA
jgi:hypothetical protein